MRGPEILARTMSVPSRRGGSKRAWQYHSRSDSHSKLACWTLMFDLLLECDVIRQAAAAGRLGFGINRVMVGPINKTLDLVLTVIPPERAARSRRDFSSLATSLGVLLTAEDRLQLEALPALIEDHKADVSEIAIAVEAKACMTEHVKSLPRLHAEILATGYLAKRAAPRCITVSYSLVNCAPSFVSPSGAGKLNRHQPEDFARRVVNMISSAVPMVGDTLTYGYDVIGITAISCLNDGSPVKIIENSAVGPARSEHTHYERMVRGICSEYRARFTR
jgi:hypothetical protein